MRVWFDGQCFQTTSADRGIGRYVRGLIGGLAQDPELELIVSLNGVMPRQAKAARQMLAQILPEDQIKFWHGLSHLGECRERHIDAISVSEAALAHHVACLAPDVAIVTSPFEGATDAAVTLKRRTSQQYQMVGVFYDAIPLRFPDHYLGDDATRAFLENRMEAYAGFDHVFAISEFAKSEVEALVPGVSVTAIGAGVSGHFQSAMQGGSPERPVAKPPYLLYVGAFDWRKNVAALIRAFALLPAHIRDAYDLRLVGPNQPDELRSLAELWRGAGLPSERLIICNNVNDVDLVTLYQGASLVIQPSLMEGFGLTALEAMACGAPVIVSRGGALEEVVGYPEQTGFDPLVDETICERMASVLTSAAKRKELVACGLERAQGFTWERTAKIAGSILHAIGSNIEEREVDLDILRQETLECLPRSIQHNKDMPALLAGAEPASVSGSRLCVDVTMTAQTSLKTGIQRVLTRMATAWRSSGAEGYDTVVFVYGDDATGFYQTELDETGIPLIPRKSGETRIVFQPGDCVLLLDSSWQFHAVHEELLGQLHLLDVRVISVVFDLLPLQAPAFFHPDLVELFARWINRASHYSDGFVCISADVAQGLETYLSASQSPWRLKIGHWDLGAEAFEEVPHLPCGVAHRPTRFLMVGSIEPRKGHIVALRAIAHLQRLDVPAKLVVVGRVAWGGRAIAKALRRYERLGWVEWYADADDAVLSEQYKEADGLIAASYAEGFGLPLVEALQAGLPVLASDIAVFRDIADRGGAMRFFEVGNAEALADQMRDLARGEYGGPDVVWPTWPESASQLARMLSQELWSSEYIPAQVADASASLSDQPTGTEASELMCHLTLVDGPTYFPELGTTDIVVCVTNGTQRTWSPRTLDRPSDQGVFVTSQLIASGGRSLAGQIAHVPVCAAMKPKDRSYIRVSLGLGPPRGGADKIRIALVDSNQTAIGAGLLVKLP